MLKCHYNKFTKQLYRSHVPAWIFCKFGWFFQNSLSQEFLHKTTSRRVSIIVLFKKCYFF